MLNAVKVLNLAWPLEPLCSFELCVTRLNCVKKCAIGDFNFRCQYLCRYYNLFYDFIISVDIFTEEHSIDFIFHGEIRYFCHGQSGDSMTQDSPATHNNNNYTVAFYI